MAAGSVLNNPHPLTQPETLGRILTDIATNAAPTAIVELIRWLDSFHFEGEVPLPQLARLVATLDEAAQPQLRQASGLYLSNVFGSRSVRYKALGRDFYASLGRAYDLVLNGLSGDFSIEPSDSLRTSVTSTACRPGKKPAEVAWLTTSSTGVKVAAGIHSSIHVTISSRLRHDDAVTRSWRNEMR